MASPFAHNHQNEHLEPEDGAGIVADIEELIAAVGVKGFVAAVIRSTAGGELDSRGSLAALRVVQLMLPQIIRSKNARLEAEVMALGAGLILDNPETMERIGGKYGISKQAVSKRVVKFCDENGLPPSSCMKSKKARANYRLSNQPKLA